MHACFLSLLCTCAWVNCVRLRQQHRNLHRLLINEVVVKISIHFGHAACEGEVPDEGDDGPDIEPDMPEPTDSVSSLGQLCGDALVQTALELTNQERASNGVNTAYACDDAFAEAAGTHLQAVCQYVLMHDPQLWHCIRQIA